jgi:hypothetical protein
MGWLIGLVPLALGVGFLTYHVRNIALAGEAFNSLNPIRVSDDVLYGEGGELAVFIIDNEAYSLNKVLVPGFSSYVLIYTLIPIGIQDRH